MSSPRPVALPAAYAPPAGGPPCDLLLDGRAGVPFDQEQVGLWAGVTNPRQLQLVASGTPTPYREADAAAIFAG